MMDKVQKPSNSECFAPPSETFRSGLTVTALTRVYFKVVGKVHGTGGLPPVIIIRISAIAIISAIKLA
jgi:hypothetical protein